MLRTESKGGSRAYLHVGLFVLAETTVLECLLPVMDGPRSFLHRHAKTTHSIMTSRGSPSASGYADASFTQGTGSGPPPATFQQDLGRPEIELGVSLSGAVPPPNLCKGKNEAYERAERLLERAIRSRGIYYKEFPAFVVKTDL